LTVEQFRARFPIFAHTIYVNSCSQGALSLDVRAALDAFTASWDRHGSPWERWVGEVDRLRAAFAVSIGAAADEIAVMPSASAAIAAIATALSFDGDRRQVLLSEFEFPTMAHVWLAQQRRGAIVDRVPAHGETLPIAHYQTRIDERTLIVPAAHVCFRNGYRLDVVALASLCKKRGAYLMLDDYQRTGTAPLDVHALGVDFLVTGALKYLLGPAGIAFLYVRRELIERFEPLSTGWFGRVNPFAFSLAPLDWAASARRFETGTPPVANVYAAAAGLDLLNALGPAAIDAQIRRLTARMVDGARRRGFALATPHDPEQRGALVVVRSTDAGALVQRLETRGIVASARGTGLRVSFHAYNNDDDVDAVLAGLEAEAALVGQAG
jgi:selenocysteine lyase/cysteine desulfurase